MIELCVSSILTEDAPTVSPETSIADAASHLRDPEVQAIVVTDGGDVVGIVTESDVTAAVAEFEDDSPVSSFMSSPVVITGPSTPLELAAERMREAGVRTLPVVDRGTYRGLVTRERLEPYLSRRSLDIEWTGEPLSAAASEPGNAVATDD